MTTSGPGSPHGEPNEPLPQAPPVYERDMVGAHPTGARAASVDMSFKLWVAAAAVYLLNAVLGFAFTDTAAIRDEARDSLREAGKATGEGDIDALITAGLVLGLIVVLIIVALVLLFVFKMRAGRGWARITLTVLGVIAVVLALLGLFSPVHVVTLLLSVAFIVLVVAAIYFMFRPDANQYFEPRRS